MERVAEKLFIAISRLDSELYVQVTVMFLELDEPGEVTYRW
jgi:hypothetical protein